MILRVARVLTAGLGAGLIGPATYSIAGTCGFDGGPALVVSVVFAAAWVGLIATTPARRRFGYSPVPPAGWPAKPPLDRIALPKGGTAVMRGRVA